MKTTRALLFAAAAAAAILPVAGSPSAQADVCAVGEAPGTNGCVSDAPIVGEGIGILGSIAVADAIDEWHQRAAGRPPCFTPEGVPYYTPGNSPCL